MKTSYQETVDYLFGLLPMYQRTGKIEGKFDLSKTEKLLEHLGDPHKKLTIVHVGGTNGKGTVCHTIASLCTADGMRTGLYTSPHYIDLRERIRIDGALIPEAWVVEFVDTHKSLIEATGVSFFEFTVAMAFAYFAEEQVDLVVLEVGMGGRLDSTNVVDPILSVITNIDLEHTEMLGTTLEAIAAEKAGIIKAKRPVVIGTRHPKSWPVFTSFAERLQAEISSAEELVQIEEIAGDFHVQYPGELVLLSTQELSSKGPFALENLRTSLAAYSVLQDELDLRNPKWWALKQLGQLSGFTGRFITLSQNPLILADAAHNLPSWRVLVPEIIKRAAGEDIHVVCGFVEGKKPREFVDLWPVNTRFYVGQLDLPRNRDAQQTADELQDSGRRLDVFPTISAAYDEAVENAQSHQLIFVGASSFVVGALLEYLVKEAVA